jgi:ADP-heptose:LPS heptosyltransferase
MKKNPKRMLVIRLSSLGDILLATSFLENLPAHVEVDWIVRSEFEFALKGHPKIHRLISFHKKNGMKGWLHLIRSLSEVPYEARVDLHRSLRSQIAFLYFRYLDLAQGRRVRHLSISKQRFRTSLYFLGKSLIPDFLKPTPYWIRFAKIAKKLNPLDQDLLTPSYLPVLAAGGYDEKRVLSDYDLFPSKYYAVMPAASFRTKEWGAEHYLNLISQIEGMTPLLVGREADPACRELRLALKNSKIFFKDALAESDFKKTAILLKSAQFYLGSDTGLAHLAEAVGTRSFVVFGPTRPGLGFGPWRKESKSIYLPLACSPCSKDGKFCYRFFSPYACLKKLDPSTVRKQILS